MILAKQCVSQMHCLRLGAPCLSFFLFFVHTLQYGLYLHLAPRDCARKKGRIQEAFSEVLYRNCVICFF